MNAHCCGKPKGIIARWRPKWVGAAARSSVRWAKLLALSLCLFFYLPLQIPVLLLARTRAGQLTALILTLLFYWPTFPAWQRKVAKPRLGGRQFQIAPSEITYAPVEDLARLPAPPCDLTVNALRPIDLRVVDLFARPADEP